MTRHAKDKNDATTRAASRQRAETQLLLLLLLLNIMNG
jgi:hypothetical protein